MKGSSVRSTNSTAEAAGWQKTNSHPVSPEVELAAGIQVGIDYLTLSIRNIERKNCIFEKTAECLLATKEEAKVGHGYKGVLVLSGLGSLARRTRANNPENEDLLLNLPGRALDLMRDVHFPTGDLTYELTDQQLCYFFWQKRWTATRIDLVMDTHDPDINPALVFDAIQSDYVSGPPKHYRRIVTGIRGRQRKSGEGETVYLGGRGSTRMLRCYDKGEEVRTKLDKDVGHLTRFELEVRQAAAERIFGKIAMDGANIIPGFFSGWVNFKDPNNTATRMERRPNAEWWNRLVAGAKPISLGLARGISTPERQLHWVKYQCAKVLKLAVSNGFGEEIKRACDRKAVFITEAEKQNWAAYRTRRDEARKAFEGGAR